MIIGIYEVFMLFKKTKILYFYLAYNIVCSPDEFKIIDASSPFMEANWGPISNAIDQDLDTATMLFTNEESTILDANYFIIDMDSTKIIHSIEYFTFDCNYVPNIQFRVSSVSKLGSGTLCSTR